MTCLFFGETGEVCPHSAACTPTHPQIALKLRIAEIILQALHYLINFSQRSLRGAEIWHIWQHHVIEGFWKIMTPVSPIFKAVREKRCTAWYTLAKRSPTAPESALARDSEPSNGDTRGGLPSPPLASPLQPPTDAAPRTPAASRPVAQSITTESAPWHGRLGAHTWA